MASSSFPSFPSFSSSSPPSSRHADHQKLEDLAKIGPFYPHRPRDEKKKNMGHRGHGMVSFYIYSAPIFFILFYFFLFFLLFFPLAIYPPTYKFVPETHSLKPFAFFFGLGKQTNKQTNKQHQPGIAASSHDRIPESHVRTLPAGTAPPENTFAPRNDFNVLAAEAYQFATASAGADADADADDRGLHHDNKLPPPPPPPPPPPSKGKRVAFNKPRGSNSANLGAVDGDSPEQGLYTRGGSTHGDMLKS